ncbi:uncharacterized protein DEA37_0000247 [Paragonimus westermani]|uniref:Uncharacterized protein n=1 Tax=Paragonimus westermani TaxID=34504 RepID=A0A5J4NC73_9TREM|nr:uncharacterized protein DEA37_0000247 [Paragonimus westermani]
MAFGLTKCKVLLEDWQDSAVVLTLSSQSVNVTEKSMHLGNCISAGRMSDSSFLEFFFARLQQNRTGRYEKEFPYWSPCGRERNFIRCDDRPIVFLDLFRAPSSSAWILPYGTALTKKLLVPFQPKHLYMCPHSGRIYHPTVDLDACSGMDLDSNDLLVGLLCSRLAVRIGDNFQWSNPRTHEDGSAPHSFTWDGSIYKLSDALSGLVHPLN